MDVQKVTAEYRLSQWAQVIKARQESGQTIKDFCQTAGISRYKYFYWQRKLRAVSYTHLDVYKRQKYIIRRIIDAERFDLENDGIPIFQ